MIGKKEAKKQYKKLIANQETNKKHKVNQPGMQKKRETRAKSQIYIYILIFTCEEWCRQAAASGS